MNSTWSLTTTQVVCAGRARKFKQYLFYARIESPMHRHTLHMVKTQAAYCLTPTHRHTHTRCVYTSAPIWNVWVWNRENGEWDRVGKSLVCLFLLSHWRHTIFIVFDKWMMFTDRRTFRQWYRFPFIFVNVIFCHSAWLCFAANNRP